MARLTRPEYKPKISPVGVVKNQTTSGLWESIGEINEAVMSEIIEPFAKEKALKYAQEHRNTSPNERIQQTLIAGVNNNGEIKEQSFAADIVKQRATKDPGIFGNVALTNIRDVSEFEDALNIEANVLNFYEREAEKFVRPENEDYGNVDLLEARIRAFEEVQLKELPSSQYEKVIARLLPNKYKTVNLVRSALDEHKEARRKNAWNQRGTDLFDDIKSNIGLYGFDSEFAQSNLMSYVDHIKTGRKFGYISTEEEEMAAYNKIAALATREAAVNEINTMLSDGLSDEEELETAEALVKLRNGTAVGNTYVWDSELGNFKLIRQPIGLIIPDQQERNGLAQQIASYVESARNIVSVRKNFGIKHWVNKLSELRTQIRDAAMQGNSAKVNQLTEETIAIRNNLQSVDTELGRQMLTTAIQDETNALNYKALIAREQSALATIQKYEDVLKPDFVSSIDPYKMDTMTLDEYRTNGDFQNRVAFVEGQAKLLEEAYNKANELPKGAAEFLNHLRDNTSTTNPSKDTRDYLAGVIPKEIFDPKFTADQIVDAHRSQADKGYINTALANHLTSVIQNLDSSEQSQRLFERGVNIFRLLRRSSDVLTNTNVKDQLGADTYRVYNYAQTAFENAQTIVGNADFTSRVLSLFKKENVMTYSDLREQGLLNQARKGIQAFRDEPWFGDEESFWRLSDYPMPSFEMLNDAEAVFPEFFEATGRTEADIESATSAAMQNALTYFYEKGIYAHDDPSMDRSKVWAKYPVSKKYNLGDLHIRSEVRSQLAKQLGEEAVNYKFREHGVADTRKNVLLQAIPNTDPRYPKYHVIVQGVKDMETGYKQIPKILYSEKTGKAVVIDLKAAAIDKMLLEQSLSAVESEIRFIDETDEIQRSGMQKVYDITTGAEPHPLIGGEDVELKQRNREALMIIRNAMLRHPENIIATHDVNIQIEDLQSPSSNFFSNFSGHWELGVPEGAQKKWLEENSGCPYGFIMIDGQCSFAPKPEVKLGDLEYFDAKKFLNVDSATLITEPRVE